MSHVGFYLDQEIRLGSYSLPGQNEGNFPGDVGTCKTILGVVLGETLGLGFGNNLGEIAAGRGVENVG